MKSEEERQREVKDCPEANGTRQTTRKESDEEVVKR